LQNIGFLFFLLAVQLWGRVLPILDSSPLPVSRMGSFGVRMSSLCSGKPIFPSSIAKALPFAYLHRASSASASCPGSEQYPLHTSLLQGEPGTRLSGSGKPSVKGVKGVDRREGWRGYCSEPGHEAEAELALCK